MALNQQLFQQRLAAVRNVSALDVRVIDAIAALLQDADDWKSFRINPIAFAERLGVPISAALDGFLHAARAGLLELRFNVVCPGCGGVEYQADRMDLVPEREWHCVVCDRPLKSELDDRVEVSFAPELGVRHLELGPFKSVENYWRFYFSANFVRSPQVQEFVNSITRAMHVVEPGGEVTFTLDARPGETYRLLSLDTHSQVFFPPGADGGGVSELEVTALPNGLQPREVPIARGPVSVRVVNRGDVPVGFMAVKVDWERLNSILAVSPSVMKPFLTAKMLLNNQTFRDLFRVQTLDANLRLRLRSLTLLFTDLKGSTELYDRTGDIRAYTFVREHFKVLSEAVKRHHTAPSSRPWATRSWPRSTSPPTPRRPPSR